MCHSTPDGMIIVAEPNVPDCEKVVKYAQEIPESHTADLPMVPWGSKHVSRKFVRRGPTLTTFFKLMRGEWIQNTKSGPLLTRQRNAI